MWISYLNATSRLRWFVDLFLITYENIPQKKQEKKNRLFTLEELSANIHFTFWTKQALVLVLA